jgi:hypothetical protein
VPRNIVYSLISIQTDFIFIPSLIFATLILSLV